LAIGDRASWEKTPYIQSKSNKN